MAPVEVVMKHLLWVLVLTVFILSTVSCGEADNSETRAVETAGVTDDQEADVDSSSHDIELPEVIPAVEYLELCYATSIHMPESRYGPENVFDGDTTTCWATMPGAAPDEGIYFSFHEPVDLETMTVEAVPGGSDFEEISTYQLYINGVEGTYWEPGTPVNLHWQGPVKSVFVKINSTESIHYDEQGIRYQRDVPVGISEINITVLDEEDNEVPLQIIPIASVGGTVEASSSLEPVEAYSPDFLFDSRPAFGWADGNPDSSGEGEYLLFSLDEPRRIEKLLIWNGYHRSGTHFDHNERASLISFGLEGEIPEEYRLDDSMTPQVVYLDSPLEGRDFRMTFMGVYPGDFYQDLVISELRFFDGDEWFVIATGGDEARKQANLQWAMSCDAGAFMDRQIFADSSLANDYIRQSLVIRSNGSFVIWKVDERDESEERMYADGNWQILDDSHMRIFGRLHRLASYAQDGYDPYAGTWSDQNERLDRMTIFSDTLSFSDSRISSSRGMFEDFDF